MMKHAVIGLVAAFLTVAPVLAQEKVVVADCKDGGCRCALGAVTAEEAGVALGVEPPPGHQTLVHYDGAYTWSPLTPEDIDLAVGGDGQCILELFDTMLPEDGQWQGRVTNREMSQCPAGLDAMLTPLTEAMVFPRNIQWGGAFHPDKIRMQGTAAAIDWTKAGENHFAGTGPTAANAGASSQVDIGVTYDARLIDPRLVRIIVAVKIRTTGLSQAVIDAAGLGKCNVTVNVDFAHLGR